MYQNQKHRNTLEQLEMLVNEIEQKKNKNCFADRGLGFKFAFLLFAYCSCPVFWVFRSVRGVPGVEGPVPVFLILQLAVR